MKLICATVLWATLLGFTSCKKEEPPAPEPKRTVEYKITANGLFDYGYRKADGSIHSGGGGPTSSYTGQFEKGAGLYVYITNYAQGANPVLTIKVNGTVHAEVHCPPNSITSTVP
jgi:hypothetical protein